MPELLVLVPDEWSHIAEPFVRYKNDTGMTSELMTLGYISECYPGNDEPEKIRCAIEDRHRTAEVRYVMVIGDADKFPVRYVKAINTEWGTKWYPSDLYYSDLYDADGNFDDWDADNDGLFGEIDFAGGASLVKTNIDRINMVPDVVVGRVLVSSANELRLYLDKVMEYEYAARESYWYEYPSEWFKRAVFIVDGGASPFGDEAQSDQFAQPLEERGIEVIRRYQDHAPWNDADQATRAAEVNRLLNGGVGFLHFFGHANTNIYAGWYSDNDMGQLDNAPRYPIVFSIACYPARFHFDLDSYRDVKDGVWSGGVTPTNDRPEPDPLQPANLDKDSMAEEFLVKRREGAIAYIGAVSKMEHGGKALSKYFFESYRDLPHPPTLGAMWQHALSRFAKSDAIQGMGGYYAFIHIHKVMLFGDPSLRVGGLPRRDIRPSDSTISPAVIWQAL